MWSIKCSLFCIFCCVALRCGAFNLSVNSSLSCLALAWLAYSAVWPSSLIFTFRSKFLWCHTRLSMVFHISNVSQVCRQRNWRECHPRIFIAGSFVRTQHSTSSPHWLECVLSISSHFFPFILIIKFNTHTDIFCRLTLFASVLLLLLSLHSHLRHFNTSYSAYNRASYFILLM